VPQPPDLAIEEPVPCPYCGAGAEPEQDGDVIYDACTGCGGLSGYRKASQAGPVCAAGLPFPAAPSGPPVIAATITMRRPE
jgi:hypothetical protein